MPVKVSRDEAARRLGITTRTLDRRIGAGQIEVERETNGARRVHVLLDVVEDTVETVETSQDIDVTQMDIELAVARERVRSLEDQLHAAQEREGHLLATISQLALPAPRRSWWRFWV